MTKVRSPLEWWQLSGLALGVFTYMLSNSAEIGVIAAVFGVIGVKISQDAGWIFAGMISSMCVVGALITVWTWIFDGYSIAGWVIGAAVLTTWMLLGFCQRRAVPHNNRQVGAYCLPLVVVGTYISIQRDWSPLSTLIRLGNMGEDNGVFLANIALADSGWQATMSPETGSSGGVVLSLVGTIATWLHGIGDSSVSDPIGVAISLLRLYEALVFIGCGLVVVTVLRRSQCASRANRITLVMLSVFTYGAFVSGLLRAAHLTGLLFVVIVMAAISVDADTRRQSNFSFVNILSAVTLGMTGQAWHPALLVTLLLLLITLLVAIRILQAHQVTWVVVVGVICAAAIFILFSTEPISWYSQNRWKINFYLDLFKLWGDDVRVSGWFGLLVISGALFSTTSRMHRRSFSEVVVLLTGAVAISLMIVGWLIAPYEPQYGPHKMFYLVSMSLAPVAISAVHSLLKSLQPLPQLVVMICLTLGLFHAATSPLSELSQRLRKGEPIAWADGVVNGLLMHPDKQTTCLTTSTRGNADDAWRCAQLLAGMQAASNQEALNIIYLINYCRISSREVSNVDTNIFRNLVVVVSDSDRLSSSTRCQVRGWAGDGLPLDDEFLLGVSTGIPWDLVTLFSYTGEQIEPNFDYLLDLDGYSLGDVMMLQQQYD